MEQETLIWHTEHSESLFLQFEAAKSADFAHFSSSCYLQIGEPAKTSTTSKSRNNGESSQAEEEEKDEVSKSEEDRGKKRCFQIIRVHFGNSRNRLGFNCHYTFTFTGFVSKLGARFP